MKFECCNSSKTCKFFVIIFAFSTTSPAACRACLLFKTFKTWWWRSFDFYRWLLCVNNSWATLIWSNLSRLSKLGAGTRSQHFAIAIAAFRDVCFLPTSHRKKAPSPRQEPAWPIYRFSIIRNSTRKNHARWGLSWSGKRHLIAKGISGGTKNR